MMKKELFNNCFIEKNNYFCFCMVYVNKLIYTYICILFWAFVINRFEISFKQPAPAFVPLIWFYPLEDGEQGFYSFLCN